MAISKDGSQKTFRKVYPVQPAEMLRESERMQNEVVCFLNQTKAHMALKNPEAMEELNLLTEEALQLKHRIAEAVTRHFPKEKWGDSTRI